jgi:RNA polymerase sigma-70 factor (ECF subfamily)
VRRALHELPLEQRQVLELGYFEGLSSSEIAARLQAPIGTVKSRVAAALAKLRAGFEPAGEGVRARQP